MFPISGHNPSSSTKHYVHRALYHKVLPLPPGPFWGLCHWLYASLLYSFFYLLPSCSPSPTLKRWRNVGEKCFALCRISFPCISLCEAPGKPHSQGLLCWAPITGALVGSEISTSWVPAPASLARPSLETPESFLAPSSDQRGLEAVDTQAVIDQHFGLAPKHIYFLSYSRSCSSKGTLTLSPSNSPVWSFSLGFCVASSSHSSVLLRIVPAQSA